MKDLCICLGLVLALAWCSSSQAADRYNEDPNAAARRAVNPLGSSALADVKKVQKTNNELAVTYFTGRIRQNPRDAVSYARRGKAYFGLKRYEEASHDYEKAIALDENLADAYVGRAVLRYTREDYDGSWEDVHRAEDLGGEFWPAFKQALEDSSGRER